jgi:hypothetical protein
MKPQPQFSNQFPISPKPKPSVYKLSYDGQELAKGAYALCVYVKKKTYQSNPCNKTKFKIEPVS